jgi:hypothetical protein
MIKKLKQAKDKVKALLIKSPELRDNDNRLIATYYYQESESNLLKILNKPFRLHTNC